MSELRPLSSLVAALALCACILGTLSPDRSAARPDGLTPVATITGALDDATDAEPMQASCGDGRCSPPEDARSCPRDCS